ncbi:MAG TPA: beta-galactosidase trimerization domain-containing protein, partial [Coprothermobacter proteolyticus]|nr:beta-galactosidase trimerization domain-containing protein [Coprothermobacter proteolyticus]
CETARPLAVYENDFYAGRPALTVNQYGKGKAYYITFRNNDEFLTDFYNILIEKLRREGTPLRRAIESDLPYGVTAQLRTDGEKSYVFVSNYDSSTKVVALDDNDYTDLLTGTVVNRTVELRPYAMIILERIGSK